MKKLMSVIIVLMLVVGICSVPMTAEAAGHKYSNPNVTKVSLNKDSSGVSCGVKYSFNTVKGITKYRIYCKIGHDNRTTGWKVIKDVSGIQGKSYNGVFCLPDEWLSSGSVTKLLNFNNYVSYCNGESYDEPPVKLCVTVRGMQGNRIVTGYNDVSTKYGNNTRGFWLYPSELCPISRHYERQSGNTAITIYPEIRKPLSSSWSKQFAVYVWTKGEYKRVVTCSAPSKTNVKKITLSESVVNNATKFTYGLFPGKKGIKFAVRGLNSKGQFCTNYIDQYIYW